MRGIFPCAIARGSNGAATLTLATSNSSLAPADWPRAAMGAARIAAIRNNFAPHFAAPLLVDIDTPLESRGTSYISLLLETYFQTNGFGQVPDCFLKVPELLVVPSQDFVVLPYQDLDL